MTTISKVRTGVFCLTLLVAWSAASLSASAPPAREKVNDRGEFVLIFAGHEIGKESFEIETKRDKIEASARIDLRMQQDGKTVELRSFPRLVMTPELTPVSYEWSQKGAQSSHLEVSFEASRLTAKYHTVNGEDDVREFELPRDLVILDNNVIHHYQIIALKYLRAGGGEKTFRAFIPQEALPGSLTIEDAGSDRVDVGGREKLLKRLLVTTDNARIDLWIDNENRLQKIAIPAGQLEVYRKK